MARFIERTENTARIVSVNANLLLDTPKGMSPGWEPLIFITGSDELYRQSNKEFDERSVVKFLIGDPNNPGSVLSTLLMARENARLVRDVAPREVWEYINDLYLYVKGNLQSGLSQRGRYDYLKRIIDVRSASLLPNQADLTPFENIQWMSVLKSLSGYQMYRLHMQTRVRRAAVLAFLLGNREFPRAFFYCLCETEEALRHLPRNDKPLAIIATTKDTVQKVDLAQLAQEALHVFIDELEMALVELTALIDVTYFVTEPQPARVRAS